MARPVLRISDGIRRLLQVASITILVAGGTLFVGGSMGMAGAGMDFGAGQQAFTRSFIGVLLLAPGTLLARLAFVRPLAEIVATETETAVAHTATVASEGWHRDAALPATIRIRCRGCGFLETEDASFCSSCGDAV